MTALRNTSRVSAPIRQTSQAVRSEKLSSGAKRNILVLAFVHALLRLSREMDEDTLKKEGVDVRHNNKHYKTNKKIDRRLEKLEKEVSDTIESLMRYDTARWLKKKTQTVIPKVLKTIPHKVSLESLAIWILFLNFFEKRDPVLHPAFDKFTNPERYMQLADLIEDVLGDTNSEMFLVSYDCIERLK